jgi:hypothetical protein
MLKLATPSAPAMSSASESGDASASRPWLVIPSFH